MEGQVGIDRVIGARIRNADRNINKKYKDITNPNDRDWEKVFMVTYT